MGGRGVTGRLRGTLRDLVRPSLSGDATLLPKVLAAFVAVLALASLTTLLLEARLTRVQLREQAVSLFAEQGEVLANQIAQDAARIRQLMATVSQGRFQPDPSQPATDRARDVLSIVRTSSSDTLDIASVVDATSGQVALGLPSRHQLEDPGPDAIRAVVQQPGATHRVVPLRGEAGGPRSYAVAYVLPVARITDEPQVLVTGYPLDVGRARRFREQTGVDDVEIVVDGRVVASTDGNEGEPPAGDPTVTVSAQTLDDGRLLRYVAIGGDRAWDTPATIGLLVEDPLATLDARLARTRGLMVLLLVLVGGSLAFALARVMTRPVVELTATATAIAGGDLERSFQVDRRDEIGRLAGALERMRRALRAQLLVIRQQAAALREAARRIVAAQDQERQRIARDLHDGIQQQLVVLRMQVGAARLRLERDPAAAAEVTDGLATSIDELLVQLRSTGQDLFPSILADRGLGGALFSLASRVEVTVEVELDPDPLPRVEREVETNAYFLAAEAVTNALKHAQASRIRVIVAHEGDVLRLQVVDDGVGFDPSGVEHGGGLVHLRDRVNALGGTMQLVSTVGEGTSMTALLPVGDDDEGSAGPLEVEQHRGDPTVEVDLLGQAELPEDGVGVLLDRPVGDRQFPGDRGVAPP
jgi:signal transduction histidine kinase